MKEFTTSSKLILRDYLEIFRRLLPCSGRGNLERDLVNMIDVLETMVSGFATGTPEQEVNLIRDMFHDCYSIVEHNIPAWLVNDINTAHGNSHHVRQIQSRCMELVLKYFHEFRLDKGVVSDI